LGVGGPGAGSRKEEEGGVRLGLGP